MRGESIPVSLVHKIMHDTDFPPAHAPNYSHTYAVKLLQCTSALTPCPTGDLLQTAQSLRYQRTRNLVIQIAARHGVQVFEYQGEKYWYLEQTPPTSSTNTCLLDLRPGDIVDLQSEEYASPWRQSMVRQVEMSVTRNTYTCTLARPQCYFGVTSQELYTRLLEWTFRTTYETAQQCWCTVSPAEYPG